MFRFTSLVLFIVLSLINEVSSDWCYDSDLRIYYCSSILVLMICIRCCIQINSNNTQSNPRRIPRSAQNRGYSPTTAPVHNIREDAPPSYAIATTSTTEITKY